MRGGGSDGKDKKNDDRRSRADEAVLVWGKGTVVGERGGTALCEPRAVASARTVRYRAIEIDAQEAVSRFLNVHGKSGGQSVNF